MTVNNFAEWYMLYPRKVGRGDAERAYQQQIKAGYPHDELMAGIRGYSAYLVKNKADMQFIPYPASWLRGKRWMDEGLQPTPPAPALTIPACWKDHADRLIKEIGPAVFGAYFIPTTIEIGPPTKIVVRTTFLASKISNKFRFPLQRAFGPDVIVTT